ncbi:Chaperone protein DnaK [bacterium HR09]|nr:Chaperone protein DnaK [bacterium HR09]
MSKDNGNGNELMLVNRLAVPDSVPSPIRVLGIDLGTTNSTVAQVVWSRGQEQPPAAQCLEIEQPTETGPYIHVLVPSVVALHRGQIWVGEGAKRLRALAGFQRNKDIFYECKNDIGARRTYHLAPEGFRNAAEIASHVLRFLKAAADGDGQIPPSRTVITVPASFQVAQRADTVRAAQLAGFDLQSGDLLDEPVAAFLDYLVTYREKFLEGLGRELNVVVFDFGGGTCDVAVFKVDIGSGDRPIEIAPLAVSRYHRLGGGDIDVAIVHQVLIPQLAEQNGLDLKDLDYNQRKRHLEPALLSVAEALKVGLCIEIARLMSFGRYAGTNKQDIAKTHPGTWPCPCPGLPSLVLNSPRLTAASFEEILKPFLDTDFLYARETEYGLTCSIFAPLQDALERAGLRPKDLNLCLMVGGSSLIPQVQEAMRSFLPGARLLTYGDRDSTQVAVARGAAYHALALALFGRGLVQPVAPDSISLRIASGLLEVIPKGALLPFPGPNQFAELDKLAVPQQAVSGTVPLRVELVTGNEARPVFTAKWEIPAPVNRGDPLRLRVQMDANQCLHLELSLRDQPDAEPFACTVENPLTLVVNPHAIRERIEEVEEDLRTGKVAPEKIPDTLWGLAEDYSELGQLDKAIEYLQQALRRKGRPDGGLLNALGILYGRKQDWERQEKAYREAFRAAPHWADPLFNLALSQFHRGQLDLAEKTILEALAVQEDPPYLILHALILEKRGEVAKAKVLARDAVKRTGPLSTLDDWTLGWLRTAARILGDSMLAEEVAAEQKRRARQDREVRDQVGGFLPEIKPSLRRL